MRLKIARWGNSTAVRLPTELVERFGWKPGDTVDVDVDDAGIRVKPPGRSPRVPTLAEIVASMPEVDRVARSDVAGWPLVTGPDQLDDWPEYDWGDVDPDRVGQPIRHDTR